MNDRQLKNQLDMINHELAKKAARRRQLAKLPFEEKVENIEKLRDVAVSIRKTQQERK